MLASCTTDCTDADGDGDHYCGTHDCNDQSAQHWDDCTTCVDTDGDGHGPGCDLGSADCAPDDSDNWVSCATCVDADGDGFFTHCDAYTTRKGPDCDDGDAVCNSDCGDLDQDSVRLCDGDCNASARDRMNGDLDAFLM